MPTLHIVGVGIKRIGTELSTDRQISIAKIAVPRAGKRKEAMLGSVLGLSF